MNPRRTTIAGITGTPAEKRRDKEKKEKKERKEKKPFMGSAYGEGFYARAESKPKPKPKGPAVTVDESALPPKRAKQPTTVISGGGRRGPKNPSGRIVEKEYSNPPRKVKMK